MNNQQLNLRAAEYFYLAGQNKDEIPDKGKYEFWVHGFNPTENWKDAGLLLKEMKPKLIWAKYGDYWDCGKGIYHCCDENPLAAITQCYIAWKESE